VRSHIGETDQSGEPFYLYVYFTDPNIRVLREFPYQFGKMPPGEKIGEITVNRK